MTKFYKHPSYDGLANELLINDDRMSDFEKDYNERGFDDTVTWDLHGSLIKWITPRLERFLEISKDINIDDDFHKDVKTMLTGFQFYLSGSFKDTDDKHIEIVNKSLKILNKVFWKLWW